MPKVYLFLIISFVLGLPWEVVAQKKQAAAPANSVGVVQPMSLLNKRLSLSLPAGFRLLAIKKATRRFADNDAPRYLYSNLGQTAYVMISFEEIALESQDLPKVKAFVEATQKDYSGWITSEIVRLNDTSWFHFEWQTASADNSSITKLVPPGEPGMKKDRRKDTPEHFQEYSTSLDHFLLHIVYRADLDKYPQIKPSFDGSIASIKVKTSK